MSKIPFGRPILGDEERSAVEEVLRGSTLVHGPRMRTFEEAFADFTGAPAAAAVANCTAGLHLSHLASGLSPGDEVIVPAMTHVATVHAVVFCGGRPIFVDAEPRTGNIEIEAIEQAITDRTRGISVVHFLGLPVEMDRITAIADAHDLYVVEDCALAVGTRYKGRHAGLFGDFGAFSFYPAKHMTTGEGGMVISRDPKKVDRIREMRAFGLSRKNDPTVLYDVVGLGFNYRLNECACAMGIEQVKRLPEILSARRKNHEALREGLSGFEEFSFFDDPPAEVEWAPYCLPVHLSDRIVPKRREIVERLKAAGIGTSIYYPSPVPLLSYYRERFGYREGEFPVAERIAYGSIALPVGPHLDEDDIKHIVETMKSVIKEVRG